MNDLIYIGLTAEEIRAVLYYLDYSENLDAKALYFKIVKELE